MSGTAAGNSNSERRNSKEIRNPKPEVCPAIQQTGVLLFLDANGVSHISPGQRPGGTNSRHISGGPTACFNIGMPIGNTTALRQALGLHEIYCCAGSPGRCPGLV
jgi:hypothetical protein